MRLENNVAIVTRASREGQVGEAIVEALAREGADVVIAARTQENINMLAEKVRATGRRALAVETDCTNEDEVKNLVQEAMDEFGQVDVLVNVAGGLTKYGPIAKLTVDERESPARSFRSLVRGSEPPGSIAGTLYIKGA
jgi:NADP-dependent 3-hydroxy acid dehydrogenase YdfG